MFEPVAEGDRDGAAVAELAVLTVVEADVEGRRLGWGEGSERCSPVGKVAVAEDSNEMVLVGDGLRRLVAMGSLP